MLAWIAGIVVAVIVVGVVAIWVIVHTAWFHRKVLNYADVQASSSLHTAVSIQNFNLHVSLATPSLDLYGIRVAGAAPYTSPPLLEVAHLHVGIRILSLAQQQWQLRSLVVDQPRAHVYIGRHGQSNLPNFSSGKSSSSNSTNIFKLGIRRAVLNHGRVWFNNREQSLAASLQGVRLQSAFNTVRDAYHGRFGYRRGVIQYGSYRPLAHSLDVHFDATPARLKLTPLAVVSGPLRLHLAATIRNYSNPNVAGTYRVRLNTAELRGILRNSSLPAGVITAAGKLGYAAQPGQSLLQSLSVAGTVSSPGLSAKASGRTIALRSIAGRYRLAHGNFELSQLSARLLGGRIHARARMLAIGTPNGAGSAELTARGEQLARLLTTASGPGGNRVAQARIHGTANLAAAARWRGTFHDLTARLDAGLRAQLANASGGTAPVNGAIHARYAARSSMLALRQTYLTLPATELRATGELGLAKPHGAHLSILFTSSNLHELETLADLLRAQPGQVPAPWGLYGAARFSGQVAGSLKAPHLTGRATATNLRLHGTAWKSLATDINAEPSGVQLTHGQLIALPAGSIRFTLAAGLRNWSFSTRNPIQARVTASRLNITALAKAAGQNSPLIGLLSANLAVRGSVRNPVGQGVVTIAPALLKTSSLREPIQSLRVAFHGNGARVVATAALKLPAGTATLAAVYHPQTKVYSAQLHADNINLQKLNKARGMGLAGMLNINGAGQGSVAHPEFQATIASPRLVIANQVIQPLTLTAGIANDTVVATLAARAQGAVGASRTLGAWLRGNFQMSLRGEEMATAHFDTQMVPLGPLVAAYSPSLASGIAGETEIHASLAGPIKHIRQMQAQVNLPIFHISYKNRVQLGAATPIRLRMAKGVLSIQSLHIEGTGTNLLLTGSIPVQGAAPMAVDLLGAVDLRVAQIADPSLVTAGQLQMSVHAGGSLSAPKMGGYVKIVNASLSSESMPLGLSQGNGLLTLTPHRLLVTRFNGQIGGGQVSASGGIAYRPALAFDLGMSAKYISILFPRDLRETFGGNIALTGNMKSAMLQGQIQLYRVSATPQFDVTTLASQVGGGGASAAPGSFEQNLRLNIGLTTPIGISTETPTFSIAAGANLMVTGTAASPIVLGRVNINRGDMIFNGNRFLLRAGTLMFANPAQTIPNVNLSADTSIQQYKLHLRFEGTADKLRTQYTSTPPLPPADIINLLAFGQTTEASAANPTPGSLGAENMVASSVASQVTGRVQKIAGISQLSVDPILGGNGQNPGARVNIRQRVTGNLYITLSTDVTSTQNDMIEIQYNFTPKKSVDLVRDQNGGLHFNTRFKKTW